MANYFGARNPQPGAVVPADLVGTVNISSAGAIATFDWPNKCSFVSFSAEMPFYVNFSSTAVALPSSASSATSGTSNRNVLNPALRQITGGSTGCSLTARTSGFITIECWSKGST